MKELKFDDSQNKITHRDIEAKSVFTRIVIKYSFGLIRSEKIANLVLIIIASAGFLITISVLVAESQSEDFNPNIDPETGEILIQEV